jgi:hypothetical protein
LDLNDSPAWPPEGTKAISGGWDETILYAVGCALKNNVEMIKDDCGGANSVSSP